MYYKSYIIKLSCMKYNQPCYTMSSSPPEYMLVNEIIESVIIVLRSQARDIRLKNMTEVIF